MQPVHDQVQLARAAPRDDGDLAGDREILECDAPHVGHPRLRVDGAGRWHCDDSEVSDTIVAGERDAVPVAEDEGAAVLILPGQRKSLRQGDRERTRDRGLNLEDMRDFLSQPRH